METIIRNPAETQGNDDFHFLCLGVQPLFDPAQRGQPESRLHQGLRAEGGRLRPHDRPVRHLSLSDKLFTVAFIITSLCFSSFLIS